MTRRNLTWALSIFLFPTVLWAAPTEGTYNCEVKTANGYTRLDAIYHYGTSVAKMADIQFASHSILYLDKSTPNKTIFFGSQNSAGTTDAAMFELLMKTQDKNSDNETTAQTLFGQPLRMLDRESGLAVFCEFQAK